MNKHNYTITRTMSSRSPEWEHNSFDDSVSGSYVIHPAAAATNPVSGMDWYNYYFHSRDRDDEYTLEDLKHLDKETRESIIDYTVEDTFDIAREVEQLLNLQLICHNNNSDSVETSLTSNLLKQFRRIMNLD